MALYFLYLPNGNIQKGLLVAGTLASGGMLGFGLAAGSLGTAQIFAGAMGVSSGLANSYEVFSGDRIGDGTFTRVLGATAAVTGGFFAPGVSSFGTFGRGLSGASGLVSGYEIASGNTIGDGTFSSLFHVSNLGVNQGSTLFNSTASAAQRFSVGLNLAVGGASLVNTGDRGLQQALRSLSIASGVWNTGSSAVTAYHSTRATMEVLRPKPIQVTAQGSGQRSLSQSPEPDDSEPSGVRTAGYSSDYDSGMGVVRIGDIQKTRLSDDELTALIRARMQFGDPAVHAFMMEYDLRLGYRTEQNQVPPESRWGGTVSPIYEGPLHDNDGRQFRRFLFHEDVSEFEVLLRTQTDLRHRTQAFKTFNQQYLLENPIPESTSDWLRPSDAAYDAMMARRKQEAYQWMAAMGATEAEISSKKFNDFVYETVKPGGYMEQGVVTLGLGAVTVKGAMAGHSQRQAMSSLQTGQKVNQQATSHVEKINVGRKLNPKDLRYSQTTAGGGGRADQLRNSMRNGWNGPGVDVVQTENGMVTIDNTRVAVASELGMKEVPVNIHWWSEPLPESMQGRFGSSLTWGDALQFRTGNQRPPLPPNGTFTPPRLGK